MERRLAEKPFSQCMVSIQISLGGEHQILNELLATIGSWTVVLATLDDFFAVIDA